MSDLLSIGASGVRAYQTALNVVGENIANTGTAGYVRRDVQLRELAPGANGSPLQINSKILSGVEATGVKRSWDQYRAAEVRTTTAEAQRSEAGIVWLERVERALDTGGLSTELTRFFNAAQGVAADPTGTGPRTAMIEAGNGLATAFRSTGTGLAATADDLTATVENSVEDLNGLARSLATVNAGLSRARPDSNSQAQLMDERDRLLDRISGLVAISVATDQNGAATVSLNQPGGPVLVNKIDARTIGVETNAQGTFAFALNTPTGPEALAMKGGSLAGLSDAAIRVADARDTIDRIATDLAEQTTLVQAAGADLDGNDGTALFDAMGGTVAMTFTTTNPRTIAAAARWQTTTPATNAGTARISVATDPLGGPVSSSLRVGFAGGDINVTDPATGTVVASAPFVAGQPITLGGLVIEVTGTPADGDSFGVTRTGLESRDNSNLADLATLRTGGGYEKAIGALVTGTASSLASRRTIAEAQGAIREGAIAARDEVSGVNLDNEAVELLRFQQAYQASSRIIQVSREIFQSILDIR